MGYAYGKPWEEKATQLFTNYETLEKAVSAGILIKEVVEKSPDGFVWGHTRNYSDSKGIVASIYTPAGWGVSSTDLRIFRDIN